MAEAESLEPFCAEYRVLTGKQIDLVSACERPDFICQISGMPFGLEVVRAMPDPIDRGWDVAFGRSGLLDGMEAALLVQESVYDKEAKRASPDWQLPESTILVVQLVGSRSDDVLEYLDDEVMEELSATGFVEIWIADSSPMPTHGTVQLAGIKPIQWRGGHPHRFQDRKPYG